MAKEEQVKPSEVRGMPPAKIIKQLIKDGRIAHQNIQSIAGEYGETVKNAQEKHGVHRKALAIARSADRMEPPKLAEFLDHLDYMLDVSGLRERAASAPSMDMGDNIEKFPDAAE